MPTVILISVDLHRGFFGHAVDLRDKLGQASVLEHTLRRSARIGKARQVILAHPADQPVKDMVEAIKARHRFDKQVKCHAYSPRQDDHLPAVVAARKWAQDAWRGGLGSATIFDELLPSGPLAEAMEANKADAAYIVRGDWPLHDPALGEAVLGLHLEAPDKMKLCFTQAPPGLCGAATSLEVLRQLRDNRATFGNILGYNPKKPHVDPIGRDVNHPIPANVRDCARRFVFDTPRAMERLRAVAERLGERLNDADAMAVTDACRQVEAEAAEQSPPRLPQWVTLELTPQRPVTGPITPQHYASFEREPIDLDLAKRIIEQLGDAAIGGDVALQLGGLGDALLHPRWDAIVEAAKQAGVLGIGVETDLHCDDATVERLLDLPLDVVSVRLNADTAATYENVMGVDGFADVLARLQNLFNGRLPRSQADASRSALLPWIVPKLTKTERTLADMESFFDRWKMLAGHAVVDSPTTGCGLMPELSPVPMAPPKRVACRQLGRRMTILSDGSVALCDQDWQGRAALGSAGAEDLLSIWQRVHGPMREHAAEKWNELDLCGRCDQWHRV